LYLNTSAARWSDVPAPGDAKVTFGTARNFARKSPSVFTPKAGLTTSTIGAVTSRVMGVKSFSVS
jgi:hypothetical protein